MIGEMLAYGLVCFGEHLGPEGRNWEITHLLTVISTIS
jgi:hypothetical protein